MINQKAKEIGIVVDQHFSNFRLAAEDIFNEFNLWSYEKYDIGGERWSQATRKLDAELKAQWEEVRHKIAKLDASNENWHEIEKGFHTIRQRTYRQWMDEYTNLGEKK